VKKLMIPILLLLVAAVPVLAESKLAEHEMLINVRATRADVKVLQSAGLYVYAVGEDFVRGAIVPSRVQDLTSRGYTYEVLIPDMVRYAEDAVKPQAGAGGFGVYHTYQQIMDTFHLIATNNPTICHLDTIARSPSGKFLLALKVTQNAQQEVHRPRFLIDGTTHGNENIGTEAIWYMVQQLVGRYGVDPLITQLVNTREVWFIPCINPEGLINRTRGNTVCADLNRDYGYAWNGESGAPVPWYTPEIRGQRVFLQQHPYVISMTFHSGTESVMWPWSYSRTATRDSTLHKLLCDRYGTITGYPSFQISRGLYECQGTSTDFMHGSEGALGLAAEISGGQPPPQGDIDSIAHANWSGCRDFIVRGVHGLRGQITDSLTGLPVKRAFVVPSSAEWMTFGDTCGWYFRYLEGGTYSLKVVADGYVTKTVTGIVVPSDSYVVVNVPLRPDSTAPLSGYKVTTWICTNPSTAGSTMGFWTLGPRDSRALTLTTRGLIVVEMSRLILNGSGTDFTVYSTTNKACSVFVAATPDSWNGPWQLCAVGSGNIACDLANAGVGATRFVKVKDAGSSYDLDAIEGVVSNAPSLAMSNLRVADSTGNNNGRLDPGEQAPLVVTLRNNGRQPALSVTGRLHGWSSYITVNDSQGTFGTIGPDSSRSNDADRFNVTASPGTPRGTPADFTLYLAGTGYSDSIRFTIVVGQITAVDPIPDGPRTPPRYYAYDDVDSAYGPHPTYQWVEISGVGTRLNLSDDQTVTVSVPSQFGPLRYYGTSYSQLSICSNGIVFFGSTTSAPWTNNGLPDAGAAAPMVCLCWDDLNPASSGHGIWYYHDAANHRYVIEYDSISHYSPSGTYEKFELIIMDTSVVTPTGDNVLLAQYWNAIDYVSVTVGIQDPSATIAIQDLFNSTYHEAAAPIAAGRAIKYCTMNPTAVSERPGSGAQPAFVTLNPNPLRASGRVSFGLPIAGRVSLKVYDASGRLVRALLDNTPRAAGAHSLLWDRRDAQGRVVNAGVYLIRLETERETVASKSVLLR
jgi:hypothetical protein